MLGLLIIILLVSVLIYFTNRDAWSYTYYKHFMGKELEVAIYDYNVRIGESDYKNTVNKIKSDRFFFDKHLNTCMLKIDENELEFKTFWDEFRPKCVKDEHYYPMHARFQKGPWQYHAHFDSMDQMCHIIHGNKKWVLFDIHFKSFEEEEKFMKHVLYMSMKELTQYLNHIGVIYKIIITKPGDSLYIKAGTYHAVEGEGNHIMVNEYLSKSYPELESVFARIWKVWYNRTGKY
jgi:hypothetical protein